MHIIKESWKKLWNAQEVRVLVLASLCLQFLLVFLAPFRKRTSQKFLILLLWLSYLVADYVAVLALGHLLKKQSEAGDDSSHGTDLMSFWAPFLLLHLGGPDTITSYSIEDNELWWRHFLGLAVQASVAFLVLLELGSVPTLRIAAAIVFIAGLIKYSERTWALRSASMNQLRSSMIRDPDPGPNYAEFMKEYVWRREAGQTTYVKRKDEPPPSPPKPSNNDAQIDEAYELFKRFKLLVVDLMLTFQDRKYGQTYFWECSVSQAFEVVAIELSFLYDVLHTKAVHIRCLRGCLWRCVSLAMLSVSLLLFHRCEKEIHKNAKEGNKNEKEKERYMDVNIVISYVLLGSAVFMELASLVIMILSDWMIVALKKHKLLSYLAIAVTKIMSILFPKGKPRWSNSMCQYSLLSFSLGDKNTIFRRILRVVKVEEFWDNFIFVDSVGVPDNLKNILFDELKTKSKRAQRTGNFKELRDCKGEKVLQNMGCTHLRWSINKEFDESILLWHIATDLCFHTDSNVSKNYDTDIGLLRQIRSFFNLCTKKTDIDREISLITANYMLYLLIMLPSLMPAGIGKIRFQDTCAEAKDFFRPEGKMFTKEEATEALLDVETEVNPAEVKGDRSKSVLFDACRLAKELNLLEEDERWCLISRIWVEMLGYAAINCKTFYHAKQLSQGGELLTHVWLLMAHMGIGEQYRIEAGHAVATLAFNN